MPVGLNLKSEEMNANLRRHLEVIQWARMEISRHKKEVKLWTSDTKSHRSTRSGAGATPGTGTERHGR